MAEVLQTRSSTSRGRQSGRAGRGGYSSRGGGAAGGRSGTRQTSSDATTSAPSLDEQGELGQLKKQYLPQLETLRELFPDWTDDDLVFALQETDGDLQRTIERITEGNVSQFADVKKKTKEKSRAKKDASIPAESTTAPTRGRGRGGLESTRGGRGRGGSERGGRGRGARGGVSSAANGSRAANTVVSVPTTETTGWGDASATTATWDQTDAPAATSTNWGETTVGAATIHDSGVAATAEGPKSSLIPEGSKKSWASMLAQPKAPPPTAAPKVAPSHPSTTAAIVDDRAQQQAALASGQEPLLEPLEELEPTGAVADVGPVLAVVAPGDSGSLLTPPKDQLTEDNLESLPDESIPAPTDTVASTRAPGSLVGSGTPYGSTHPISADSRPPMGGYATTAWKATGAPGRSASYQRRMMEQREAVVMPGNHAVDRAAVQFGSMGLNGENRPLDVDDEREEAQTRMQPQQSPPSQPRASLPPAPRQAPIPEQSIQETIPTPKQAPGLPQPPSMSAANQPVSQLPLTSQNLNQPGSQSGQAYGQYGRFAGGALGQEAGAPAQKQYDPFSQQLNYPQSQQETQGAYPAHSQPANPLPQTQSHLSGFSQGPNDYANQFSSEQQRNAYQNYYGSSYSQQNPSTQQDQNLPPQRSGSGFAAADSTYASSQANASQARFGESQNSGHTTPNPALVSQHQQVQHMHQQPPGQAGHGGNYPYGNPYYSNSFYNSYMNQYPSSYYGQQGYGAPYGGKGNMYGQPHQPYGMSPQTSYEHSSSPANAQAYATTGMQGRDSAASATGGDFARSGSAQPSQANTTSAGAYSAGMADGFGRAGGGFGQNAQYGQQQGDDALKPFGEQKAGPSPSLGQPGRAGSAVNSGYGGNQSNYPNQQQQGFGGYPSHLNQLHGSHSSQYGGLGGLGGHQGSGQSHQGSGGYGSYGSGFGGNNYGSYGRGGGWGGNYGH